MIGVVKAIQPRGLQIEAAARYLDMHPQTLRKLSDLRLIRCRRFGKRREFLREDLDAWLEQLPEWVSDGHN